MASGDAPRFEASDYDTATTGLRRITSRSRSPRPKPETSPYYGHAQDEWDAITRQLLERHPLTATEVVAIVRDAWETIFLSSFGEGVLIGQHIFPRPQIMGFLFHELIPFALERAKPAEWRAERTAADKDVVCVADDSFSIEIKTSAHPRQIFANRSYGQETATEGKKAKSGYFLAVNFEPWPEIEVRPTPEQLRPALRLIRFGWLDHSDWIAQAAATGQQSALAAVVENLQLLTLAREG